MHPATVMVDMYCGFGSYSDKMYVTGRLGADVLFARTLEDHARNMAKWLNRGLYKGGNSLQTEGWVQHLLESSGTIVERFDFHRTDLRYVDNLQTPCVPSMYYKCTSQPGVGYARCA